VARSNGRGAVGGANSQCQMTNAKATLICHRDDAFSIDAKGGKTWRKGETGRVLFRLYTLIHAWRWAAAKAVLEGEANDHDEGFADDMAGHLGLSAKALGKNDGHFHDLHTLAPDFVGHLNLETVAVRTDSVEINGLKRAAAETFEPPGRIAEGHAGNEPDIFGGAHAEHEAAQRPVDDADAVDVTGAENKVGVLGGFDELGDVIGIVGEIAIHLHDEFVILFNGPIEAGAISAAKPPLFRLVQDVNRRMFDGEFVGHLAGAVGRTAVHNEQVNGELQQTLDQRRKILPFIISRHNDERLIHKPRTRRQLPKLDFKTSRFPGRNSGGAKAGKSVNSIQSNAAMFGCIFWRIWQHPASVLGSIFQLLSSDAGWTYFPGAILFFLFEGWMFVDAIRRKEYLWAVLILAGLGIWYFFYIYRQGSSLTQGFELPGAAKRKRIKELEAQIHHIDNAVHHFQLGDVYFRQGKLDKAEACYRAALEREPTDIDARAHLGQCLARLKRPAEAKPLLIGVCAEDPKHDYGYSMMALAETLTALGERQAALDVWLKVVAHHSYPRAKVQLAEMQIVNNQLELARAELKDVLADDAHAPAFQRKRDRVWVRRARGLAGKIGLG
jgi:hypothetical protein